MAGGLFQFHQKTQGNNNEFMIIISRSLPLFVLFCFINSAIMVLEQSSLVSDILAGFLNDCTAAHLNMPVLFNSVFLGYGQPVILLRW